MINVEFPNPTKHKNEILEEITISNAD